MQERPIIIFSKSHHNGQEVLIVGFEYNLELKEYVKKFPGIQWSSGLRSFYTLFTREITNSLFQYLRAKNYYIDYSAISNKRKNDRHDGAKKKFVLDANISQDLKKNIKLFREWMQQKRYSLNTINTYESMLLQFFRFKHPKPIHSITETDIIDFNTNYILANRFSYTYQNQAINTIKLFYRDRVNCILIADGLERPKKSKKLPVVLSIDEVKSILASTPNLKHKTLLSLLYSCGLRIGEALGLRVRDIDMKRRFMHVRSAKGSKDRYVPLPERMKALLIEYYSCYEPNDFVFEGQNGGAYSTVSARQVLKRSLLNTGIEKPITLHTLRHSHATHLLENGTDLRYIQELLGHNSAKTTMIYTHVSSTSLDKIKNPFDEFDL
ncbi:tyrosine-type recombinase/integrase [Maribacter flavus]|uniref:Tyrosine-type recombinase/integrase n=1 Tax=Maribacter flavus TaxID=1658664 RepID=A0A5B2U0M2_9FLAO|nr:tyrosine-type recombinase/integrase [Maribacter flavus]KAA2219913.1 tyrosine-type recombinase/integrase [Maribacter flavus]